MFNTGKGKQDVKRYFNLFSLRDQRIYSFVEFNICEGLAVSGSEKYDYLPLITFSDRKSSGLCCFSSFHDEK